MRLAVLAVGTFAIGTDTFVFAGILDDVGNGLHVSTSAAGVLVTVFALAYALLAPVLATVTASWSRRRVLLSALALFSLGNLATAVAGAYWQALLARVLAAAGAALYAPNAAAAGAALVPEHRRARALAVVSGGLGAAMAVGAPLGTWLGGHTGWRATLWLVTALGLLALIGVAVAVRGLPAVPVASLRERLTPLRTARVQQVLAGTFATYLGIYLVYPYLSQVLHQATHGSSGRLAAELSAFGAGALLSTAVAGPLVERFGSARTMSVGVGGVAVAAGLLTLVEGTYPLTLPVLLVWGTFGWLASVSQQHRLVVLAPRSAPVYVSLNSSAQYLGVAAGSALGGPLLELAGARLTPGYAAAFLALTALAAALTNRAPQPLRATALGGGIVEAGARPTAGAPASRG